MLRIGNAAVLPCLGSIQRALSRLLLPGWVLLAALSAPAQVAEARARTIPELKAFFQQNCTRCHGLDGSAKGPDGRRLGGLDFTKAAHEFRTLSGPASEREIRTMIRTIRKGILFGYSMPAWKDQLSQEDATLMVREILLKAETGRTIEP
ncbi:MAG: cytochrome c [Geothrix sp.]|uniref:c-type cytochrome n=1 Tax=Geothrix sp. TaxID=1962974 RepID=UPI0017BFE71A|nr:cytochrome c [Geothrix sp.]NWJ40997.1 cytochrome c [Geothrix sp.]WIL21006.1 MAG: c-type cytochrome [Geothrix sp.]